MTKQELQYELECARQELQYELDCAKYETEVYRLREEIATMANRCRSLDTLKQLKADMQDTYNEYLDRWKDVAAMGNISDMVKKMSDEYRGDILKYIHQRRRAGSPDF